MKKKLFNQISVIGLGLIGSSFSLAIKKNKIANKVVGYSRSSSTRKAAKKLKILCYDCKFSTKGIKLNSKINFKLNE